VLQEVDDVAMLLHTDLFKSADFVLDIRILVAPKGPNQFPGKILLVIANYTYPSPSLLFYLASAVA
jgi:hypothetical protein